MSGGLVKAMNFAKVAKTLLLNFLAFLVLLQGISDHTQGKQDPSVVAFFFEMIAARCFGVRSQRFGGNFPVLST